MPKIKVFASVPVAQLQLMILGTAGYHTHLMQTNEHVGFKGSDFRTSILMMNDE
jgi:hypothetical protein